MGDKGKNKVVESRCTDDSGCTESLEYSWSGSNNEANEGFTTLINKTLPESQSIKRKRIELRSKAVYSLPGGVIPRVLSIVATHSMNCLKVVEVHTILEEKRLSTDAVLDRYLEIW